MLIPCVTVLGYVSTGLGLVSAPAMPGQDPMSCAVSWDQNHGPWVCAHQLVVLVPKQREYGILAIVQTREESDTKRTKIPFCIAIVKPIMWISDYGPCALVLCTWTSAAIARMSNY